MYVDTAVRMNLEIISETDVWKEYDAVINEMNPTVSIDGLTWEPAAVLKEIDPTAYEVGFNDWVSTEYEEVSDALGFVGYVQVGYVQH